MPGTRQFAIARTSPEPRRSRAYTESWHSITLQDHKGQTFQRVWKGDLPTTPFSWQVYLTIDLHEDPVTVAQFLGGVEIYEYDAIFDIYAPLASTYACIAHQTAERQHRKQTDQTEIAPEYYGSEVGLGGFIIIIDDPEWKAEHHGPLFVYFDIRPVHLKVVEPGLNDADAGIFEQIELTAGRKPQTHNLGGDLKSMWLRSGGPSWKMVHDNVLERFSRHPETKEQESAPPHPGTTEDITIQPPSTDIRPSYVHITCGTDGENANLCYDIYAIFTSTESIAADLEVLGRSFTDSLLSHLPKLAPSLSLYLYSLPDLDSCLNHHHSQPPRNIGYLYARNDKRRYPHHGREAAGVAYMDRPDYETFIVLLDKKNWANEDGVVFHWDDLVLRPEYENTLFQEKIEALAGRLPGMEMVAGRLAGII